jgi:hypothetical protein
MRLTDVEDSLALVLATALGFPTLEPVASLNSIAHLFGQSKKRCGIYLLRFPDSLFYIGQSVNVVRRFSQHRRVHNDIVGFSFMPTPEPGLDESEKAFIYRAEALGLKITNAVHMTNIVGTTDLDLILSSAEQDAWFRAPCRFNESDKASPIVLTEAQHVRFAKHFSRFQQHPLALRSLALLQQYVLNCVPAPRRTEYSFWSVSCMPSTNRSTWPRLFCVNAGVMEMFVVGAKRQNTNSLWSFVNVAKDTVIEQWGSLSSLKRAFPFVEIVHRGYRDAGRNQVSLHVYKNAPMEKLLGDPGVSKAAAMLNLRVMRKRATIYGKYHCTQLANRALARHAA